MTVVSTASCWKLYVLRSPSTDRLYIGITTNVARRLVEHNTSSRGARATRYGRPWDVALTVVNLTHSEALKQERAAKRLSKADKLRWIGSLMRSPADTTK